MEYESTPCNPLINHRKQCREFTSSSHPITSDRHLTLREENLRSDTEQGRVPTHLSDGLLDLTRQAAQSSARLQEGLRLWHGSRPRLVPPSINIQPSPRLIHQHYLPFHQHHQQHHQYQHLQHTYPPHNNISVSDKPIFCVTTNDKVDSVKSTPQYLSSPFNPCLPPLTPRSPVNTSFEITTEAMDSHQGTSQSPPTPLSSPRESSRLAGGHDTPAPASGDNVTAFFAHFPARSALVLAQSAEASNTALTSAPHRTSGTNMPSNFSAQHTPAPTSMQNRSAGPAAQSTEPADFYAYCLDRGQGMYTRLIPADTLPMMVNIPPLLASSYGMKVLPEPPFQPQEPMMPVHMARFGSHFAPASGNLPRNQLLYNNNIPPPASSSSAAHTHSLSSSQRPGKKNKIYCSKWVHDGTCAFTQQGCKYKHEMPHDPKTQRDLGLFQGYPSWYKKWQQEQAQQMQQSQQMQQIQEQANSVESFSPILPSLLVPPPPPAAPLAMQTCIPPGQQDLDYDSQHTPPFSARRTGLGGIFGSNTVQTTRAIQTTQASAWPSINQLSDSFGLNFGLTDSIADSHAQQAQQTHLLAQQQQQQQQHRHQSSFVNRNNNPATSLFPASAGSFYRPPNVSTSLYSDQGQGQAALSSPPLRDTRSRAATIATDSNVFGPIGPPPAMASFTSPPTFDRVYGQTSRSSNIGQGHQASQDQSNLFNTFSHDSSTRFGHDSN